MPALASENGKAVDNLIVYIHWLMFALFAGWLAYYLFTLWRFNRVRNPRADYHGVKNHASSYLEVAVASIEVVLLVFVAVPLWAKHADKFPAEKDSTVVQVVAQQFAWNFRYQGRDGEFGRQDMKFVSGDNTFGVDPADEKGKDDIQTLSALRVPKDKDVICYISSKDVIHSFKISVMRVTQDAIPGMRIPIHFKPNKAGTFQIYCAQLCGNGHASMAGGRLIVMEQSDYNTWLAGEMDKMKKAGGAAQSLE
jgi:cytochrome c oxidase subunit 2